MMIFELFEKAPKVFDPSAETLKLGSQGNAVKAWQWLLNKLVKSLSIDGIFGEVTKSATIKFQKQNNITNDGVVGPETYNMANRELAAKGIKEKNPYIGKGSRSEFTTKKSGVRRLPNIDTARMVFNFFKEHDFTDVQSAAWVGNFAQESGFKASAHNPDDNGSPSFGIAQWKLDRLKNLKKFAMQHGLDEHNLRIQLKFVIWELKNYKMVSNVQKLLDEKPDDIKHAVEVIRRRYEVGADPLPRLRYALAALESFAPETYAQVSQSTVV